MAIYLGDKEINGLYLGDKQVEGVYLGDTRIWPSSYRYVITEINILYSASIQIYASASNYAYATGTVQVYQGSTLIETRTNQPLTPYSIGDTTHFGISGNNITANHLHTTETDGYTTTVSWKYQSSDPVQSANVTQEANVAGTEYVQSATLSLDAGNIRCNENAISISGQTTRTLWTPYTSGDHSVRTDHAGDIDVYYNGLVIGTITSQSPIVTKSVGENYHNTLTRSWDFRGKYDTYYSNYKTVTQGADAIVETYPIVRDYYASLGSSGSIQAWGGSVTLSPSAYHIYYEHTVWQYGSPTDSEDRQASDNYTIHEIGSCSRIHRSGVNITHDNMTSNEGTDTMTYYCTNDTSGTRSGNVIVSATNSKGQGTEVEHRGQKQSGTPYGESEYAASISASNYVSNECPASGGTCTLSWSASHRSRTNTPWTQDVSIYNEGQYTSGTPYSDYVRGYTDSGTDYGTWSAWIADTVTPTMDAPSGGFSRSGSSVTIASEAKTEYLNGRYATFSITNGDKNPSVTVRQQANTLTYGQWQWNGDAYVIDSQTQNYTASLIVNDYTSSSSPAPYGGGSTTFVASGSHEQKDEWQRNKYRINTWTSLETDREDSYDTWWDSSWSTRIDTPTVNVIAGAGSWITISGNTLVISANSGSARNGTIQANNGSAFDSKIIYQAQYVAQINMIVRVSGAPVQPGIINDWYPITVAASIDVASASAISIPIEGLIITKTDSTVEELTNQYHSGTITIAAGEYSGSIQFSPSFRYKRTFSNGEKVKAKCSKPQGIATLSTPEVTVVVS